MKAKSTVRMVLGLSASVALAAGAFAAQSGRIEVPRVRIYPTVASSEFIVNGEVTARTENAITVLSRTSELTTLLVTADTEIRKAAATIKLGDISVGDNVSVTAVRAADGKLVAVEVTVRVPTE